MAVADSAFEANASTPGAPPAESVPPTTVATINQRDGMSPLATTIVGTVVTSRSSTTRNFMSATYAATLADGERGGVSAGEAMRAPT